MGMEELLNMISHNEQDFPSPRSPSAPEGTNILLCNSAAKLIGFNTHSRGLSSVGVLLPVIVNCMGQPGQVIVPIHSNTNLSIVVKVFCSCG